MKKYTEILSLIIALNLFMYLLGAFASATFDISQWNEVFRIVVTFVSMVLTIILTITYFEVKRR